MSSSSLSNLSKSIALFQSAHTRARASSQRTLAVAEVTVYLARTPSPSFCFLPSCRSLGPCTAGQRAAASLPLQRGNESHTHTHRLSAVPRLIESLAEYWWTLEGGGACRRQVRYDEISKECEGTMKYSFPNRIRKSFLWFGAKRLKSKCGVLLRRSISRHGCLVLAGKPATQITLSSLNTTRWMQGNRDLLLRCDPCQWETSSFTFLNTKEKRQLLCSFKISSFVWKTISHYCD